MSEVASTKPKFRGNWAPSVPSPVRQHFGVALKPIPKKEEEKQTEPEPEIEPEPIQEPEPEPEPEPIQEPEPVKEPEPEPEAEPEPEPIQETPKSKAFNSRTSLTTLPVRPEQPRRPRPISTSVNKQPSPSPSVETKLKDYAQEQIMNDVINHLSAERSEIHERELARELNKFKEATNDRTLQRQLDTIQFQISSQLEKQRREEQEEAQRQQAREKRCAMLQRMIKDLQNELDTELEAEKTYQVRKKKQREETVEDLKKWDMEIQRVRDRIEDNKEKTRRDREKEERADSEKVGKVQKLYYEALHHKDPNAAKKLPVPSSYQSTTQTAPLKVHRKGKTTTTPGSDAMKRLLDRLQGLESDSDSDSDDM